MFFRKSTLIRELRAEIQRLREMLARALGERDAFREMAGKAIELAKEKHFPQETTMRATRIESLEGGGFTVHYNGEHLPDYVEPEVKSCPECFVSLRADTWPQECPACHCVFGFEEKE